MNSKIRGRCGFSRTGIVRSAPEGAPTEADSWSACPDLRKAIPRFIEMIHIILYNIAIFVSLFLVYPFPAQAEENAKLTVLSQYERSLLQANIIKGIDMLYSSRFDEAEELFHRMASAYPSVPAPHFYMAMVSWSRLATGFWSKAMVEQFRERLDKAIDIAGSRVDEVPGDAENHLFLGGALGFKGRFELMKENWFPSFILASDAVDHLNRCLKIDPTNKEVLLGLGIYEYYTAKMSGILKFLTYLLIRKGGKEKGLKKLHTAAADAIYSASEAKSTLVHIYMFMEEDYEKALSLVSDLVARYPETTRYHFLKGVCHIFKGEEDAYKETLSTLISRKNIIASQSEAMKWERVADYLSVTYAMIKNDLDSAILYLERLREKADPEGDPAMVAWPLLKTAMVYDLRGEREKAVGIYHSILNMDNGSGAQFLAKRYLSAPLRKGDPFIGY
ncbi:MAG: hypothetical protein COZ70_15600 [Deltaproteobacteria bacterium CG_4_8_14_3_um_filter_51_11]|nr:MAG: hypothetical protein COZ70_15600 [Deltaproteobacteria bacterium CG_4_8_14_3_um_filter_51_11]